MLTTTPILQPSTSDQDTYKDKVDIPSPQTESDQDFYKQVDSIVKKSRSKKRDGVVKKNKKVILDLKFHSSLTKSVHQRPDLSYNELIIEALRCSASNSLSLQEIYDFISEKHQFFKFSTVAWQNSIRHNLSVQAMFERLSRPSSRPGKGGLWRIADWVILKGKPITHEIIPEFQTCVNSPVFNTFDYSGLNHPTHSISARYDHPTHTNDNNFDPTAAQPDPQSKYQVLPNPNPHQLAHPQVESRSNTNPQSGYGRNHLMDTLATLALSADPHSQFKWPSNLTANWMQPKEEFAGFGFLGGGGRDRVKDERGLNAILDPLVGEQTLLQATYSHDLS